MPSMSHPADPTAADVRKDPRILEALLLAGAALATVLHGALVLRGLSLQPWVDELQAAVMALHPLRDQIAGHHMAGNWLHEAVTRLLHVHSGLAPLTAARSAGLVAWAAVHTLALRSLRGTPGGWPRWLLLAGTSGLLAWWTPDAKTYGWFAFWSLLAWGRAVRPKDSAWLWLVLGLGPVLAHWGVLVPVAASLLIRRPTTPRVLAWAAPGLGLFALEVLVFAGAGFLPLLRVGSSPPATWWAETDAIVRWLSGGHGGAWLGMGALLVVALTGRTLATAVWTGAAIAQIGLHVALAGAAPVRYLAWWLPAVWLAAAESRVRLATPLLLLAAAMQIGALQAVAEEPTRPGPSLDAEAVARELRAAGATAVVFDPTGIFGDAMLSFAGPVTPVARVLAPQQAAASCRWLRYDACGNEAYGDASMALGEDSGLWLLIPDMPVAPRAGWFPWWTRPTRGPLAERIPGARAVRGAALIPAAAVPAGRLQSWLGRPSAPDMR